MASLAPLAPLHVELTGEGDFQPEVRIGDSKNCKTRRLTIEELIILSFCRINTQTNSG